MRAMGIDGQNFPQNEDVEGYIRLPNVKVRDFDPKEEATRIEEATLLCFSWLKAVVLMPIMSVCSFMVWPLILYWKVDK